MVRRRIKRRALRGSGERQALEDNGKRRASSIEVREGRNARPVVDYNAMMVDE